MKVGLTFDTREDYNIEADSEIFADFCSPSEIGYMASAISQCGYQISMIGNMYNLNALIHRGDFNCDLVFVADEGLLSRNREAIVPALLELNKIPYVGSDAYAMGLSQNKLHTKLVAEYLGIKAPNFFYLPYWEQAVPPTKEFLAERVKAKGLSFPLVVKPNHEGYSMGVFLVWDIDELAKKTAWNMEQYRQEVLVEEYIKGDEIYVPIVGSAQDAYALGVGICKRGNGENYDIFSLYDKCFAPIIDEVIEYEPALDNWLKSASLSIHRHMRLNDFSRVDFRVDQNGTPYFIEINPRPGLTQNGPYETCARRAGKTYADIVGEIIECAINRYGMPQSRR